MGQVKLHVVNVTLVFTRRHGIYIPATLAVKVYHLETFILIYVHGEKLKLLSYYTHYTTNARVLLICMHAVFNTDMEQHAC